MAVYRNLQEQVYENAKDIEELQKTVHVQPEVSQALITKTLNDYGIQDQDGATVIERQLIVKSPIPGADIVDLVVIFGRTYIGRDLELEGLLHCRNGKIKIGNTEITEEQLQKLLQLIQV